MLFNSLSYAFFLIIVFSVYWSLPDKCRWFFLLIINYWFYMNWNPRYVVLLLVITIVSFGAGGIIEKEESVQKKKGIVIFVCLVSLGILFFFKYFNFVSNSITKLGLFLGFSINTVNLDLVLPIGISFYTFQALSYVIDVYRGTVMAEHHIGKYATFVSFFPQLGAGPIERAKNIIPQIKAVHKFDYNLASYGLKQMAWGYFKKIVIADTIFLHVGNIFVKPYSYHGFAFVLAAFLYAIQIYCDFSGYSDIAIGTAKLFGIQLMTNFKSPYFSQSIKEFWSKWHISLSTWLRDYVYIPLGGNRVGKHRKAFNLFITFLVSGIWHGANWTFVIWGVIHGIAQIIENILFFKYKKEYKKGIIWLLRVFIVFCFCSMAWVFFASHSVKEAIYIITHMMDGWTNPTAYIGEGLVTIGFEGRKLLYFSLSLILLVIYDYKSLEIDVISAISNRTLIFRWTIYVFFLLWMIFNIPVTNDVEFIYFQF